MVVIKRRAESCAAWREGQDQQRHKAELRAVTAELKLQHNHPQQQVWLLQE